LLFGNKVFIDKTLGFMSREKSDAEAEKLSKSPL
jgi:hypothetical protein